MAGAQHRSVQRLQFFLSESTWDHEQVNACRVELLLSDPATAPHAGGVLVIDDSGDRKDGSATAHVGNQYLGSVGKIDRGVVTVTTCWADERVYYPLHAVPCTPAHHFPGGKNDPAFRTKLQIGAALAREAQAAGVVAARGPAQSALGFCDTLQKLSQNPSLDGTDLRGWRCRCGLLAELMAAGRAVDAEPVRDEMGAQYRTWSHCGP